MARKRLITQYLKTYLTEADREKLDALRSKHSASKFVRWLIRREYDEPRSRPSLRKYCVSSRSAANEEK